MEAYRARQAERGRSRSGAEYEGLLRVRIELDQQPPSEWADFFLNPIGVSISLGMHPPDLSGCTIAIQPPDKELEAYVAHVDTRIHAANEWYAKEIVPRLERAERARAEEEDERRQRVADAKKRAEDL